jgi:hypothetical protein
MPEPEAKCISKLREMKRNEQTEVVGDFSRSKANTGNIAVGLQAPRNIIPHDALHRFVKQERANLR